MSKNLGKFRSLQKLDGYKPVTVEFPPSIVDDSEYEDINVLVARMCRGEHVNTVPAVFDGDGPVDVLMAQQSPLERDGADLSDVGPLLDSLKQATEKAPVVPTTPPQGEAEKPPVEPLNEVPEPK